MPRKGEEGAQRKARLVAGALQGGSLLAAVMGDDDHKKKKKHSVALNRDLVMKRLHHRQQGKKEASPMLLLKDIFEETDDKDRFVGDIMFWKYFEDIDIDRIYHTNSVEYRNLKVMCFETVFYLFMMLCTTLYAYNLQSQNVFEGRIEQLNYWKGCDTDGNCRIQKVSDVQGFWNWMDNDLVPKAYTEYQGAPKVAQLETVFENSGFPLYWSPRYIGTTRSNVLLGALRMRQLRVKPNQGCMVSKLVQHVYPNCYAGYTKARESREEFMPRFAPTYLEQAYKWSDIATAKQTSIAGNAAKYDGAGFFIDLPANKSHAYTMLADLHRWSWIDQLTRAVVLELTTYNTNVDVIINSVIIFEFTPNGEVSGLVKSNAVRIFFFTPSLQGGQALTAFIFFVMLWIIYFIFTMWTLWLMYKTCINYLGQNPWGYLKRSSWVVRLTFPFRVLYQFYRYGWNFADMIILGTFYAHMIFRVTTFTNVSAEPALQKDVIGHPEMFMPFAKLIEPLTTGNELLSILAISCWIKLFKYLCMSSYFRLLVRIVESCGSRLCVYCVLLLVVFYGFAVAFSIGLGNTDSKFSTIQNAFLVLFFLLIDGFGVDQEWFEPGKDQMMPLIFLAYIFLIYFVLLNIFIAIVLDTYSMASRVNAVDPSKQNPMIVFLHTYYNWMKGQSLVRDDSEEHMKSEELSITLDLLPGLIRRKWVEKKRRMQRVADMNFAGMDLFPEDRENQQKEHAAISDWALPSTHSDIFEPMTTSQGQKPVELYEIPQPVLRKEVSRAQLQRLMDEDTSIPLVLGVKRAVDVIRKFKTPSTQEAGETVTAVKSVQGSVFGRIDKLERVALDEDVPNVPMIHQISEQMSGAVTDVRNQFRVQLTGVIESTAVLFEHLVELTQALDEVRANNDGVLEMVRNNALAEEQGLL